MPESLDTLESAAGQPDPEPEQDDVTNYGENIVVLHPQPDPPGPPMRGF